VSDAIANAKTPITHKSPPKGYPTDKAKYADPANYKYPLDTAKRTRAAWSYIHKTKNRKGYSADELSAIEGRIRKAAKKFDIELSAENSSTSEAARFANIELLKLEAEALAEMEADLDGWDTLLREADGAGANAESSGTGASLIW